MTKRYASFMKYVINNHLSERLAFKQLSCYTFNKCFYNSVTLDLRNRLAKGQRWSINI